MPRFYFNLYDELACMDPEGTELSDLEAARQMALRDARIIICEEAKAGRIHLSHRIEVADESGSVILTVPFSAAVEVEP